MSLKAQNISFLLSQVRTSVTSLIGGKVYAYAAGTTTFKTIWLDRDKSTVANNPYTLDSDGTAQLYADGLYRIVINDAAGATKFDRDYLSFVDVITSGVELNADDYTSLADAVDKIGSSVATLVVSSPQTVSSNLVVPSNITLRSLSTGIITVNTGQTLTINGPRSSGLFQCFDGDGSIVFGAGSVTEVYPEWWGAKGDWYTACGAAIQKAINCARANLLAIKGVRLSPGKYMIDQTLYVPDGVAMYGHGISQQTAEMTCRLQAVSGLDADIIRMQGHLFAGLYWSLASLHDFEIFGDIGTSTIGHGINFYDGTHNVIPQDTTLIYNLNIFKNPQSGINMPSGAVPIHIRDVKCQSNGVAGIYLTGLSTATIGVHFDNISGDNNAEGLIYCKNCDSSANLVFTNIKSESYWYGSTLKQPYSIVFDNCDRTAVTINGGHNTNTEPDGSYFKAPRDFIHIKGTGCPSVVWSGYAPRIRTTDTEISTSYVLNDSITGRTFHSSMSAGSYNIEKVLRIAGSTFTVTNGAGSTRVISNIADKGSLLIGSPVLVAMTGSYAGLSAGTPYMNVDNSVVLRFQNLSGSDVTLTTPYIRLMSLPNKYFKAVITEAAYSFSGLATGAATVKTMAVPCELGDFVFYNHAANQKGLFVSAYVSADDTITIRFQNETGSTQSLDAATLTGYVLNHSAFRLMAAKVYDPPSISADASTTTTIDVPGAVVGDFVMVSFNKDLAGVQMSGYVSAAGVVTVVLTNYTAGAVDLASGTLKVGIVKTEQI